ncbi:MAG: CapA family protein [Patulibacter sp.]|nr:CapA family protein [Patulibacter sp.]
MRHRRTFSRGVALAAAIVLTTAGAAAAQAPVPGTTTPPAATTPATTPPPSPSPSASASKPASHADRRVTITAVGDTMLGNTPQLPPAPYRYLSAVKDELARGSDIRFLNLEGTLTNAGGGKCGGGNGGDCYAFRNPPSYAAVLHAAGFTVANSANNHANDFGPAGLSDTSAALRGAGIAQTGRAGQIAVVKAGKVRVAFVGFAPYPWASPLLDVAAARALITKAKRQADDVVVYLHAGAEGADKTHVGFGNELAFGENRGNPRAFAHMAIDAGANLVLGSGPHVLRGMEVYRHRLIAYSLGNFAGFRNFGSGGVLSRSAILRVTLSASGRLYAGRVFPVTLDAGGRPSPGGASLPMISALSHQDFGRAAVRLRPSGIIRVP